MSDNTKHPVHVLPQHQHIEIEEKQSLLQGLRSHGFFIKSSCGGVASCGECVVKICEGKENLTAPTFAETKLMGNVFHITKERLSCQTHLTGIITVDITHHQHAPQKSASKKSPVILRKPSSDAPENTPHAPEDIKTTDRMKKRGQGYRPPRPFKASR